MTRRRKILLLLVGALALAGFWLWYRVYRVQGNIVAIDPLSGDEAIVCIRAPRKYGFGPLAWIARVDAHGKIVWSTRLDQLPVISIARGPLLVSEDLAIVRTIDDQGWTGRTTAFRIGDGAQAWSTRFDVGRTEHDLELAAHGLSIYQGIPGEQDLHWTLVSISRASGNVEWEDRLGGPFALRFAGASLVADTPYTPDTSPPGAHLHPGQGMGCIEDGEYVFIERTKEAPQELRVVGRRFDSGVDRLLATLPLPADTTDVVSQSCGNYRGRFVFSAKFETKPSKDHTDVWSGLIDVAAPGVIAKLSYRLDEVLSLRQYPFPEHEPLAGFLPRFVPVRTGTENESLAVLDLEERKIVRHGRPLGRVTIEHHGEVFFVQVEINGSSTVLARFDGKTGRTTAAVKRDARPLMEPYHVRDGRLWLYQDYQSTFSYAVLDAETLRPVATNGAMNITEALAETNGWFAEE